MAGLDWDYEVVWDGGCQPNPGLMWGSYRIQTRTGRTRIERCRFEYGTNNEAEYRTLLTALGDLLLAIQQARRSPNEFTLVCRGDSQIVIRQLTGEYGINKASLRDLHGRARQMLKKFKKYELVWQPRAKTVEVLGH